MKYALPDLKFKYAGLEPHIDTQTMEIHYTKHHQGYIDKLNATLENLPDGADSSLETLLQNLDQIPGEVSNAVRNNGGGHYNHSLFWDIMTPNGKSEPQDVLAQEIKTAFGSFETFKEQFTNAALTRFGSGWAWLVVSPDKKLEVVSTPNQDSPIMENKTPILGLDVWEHAYYLKYQMGNCQSEISIAFIITGVIGIDSSPEGPT